MENWLNYTHTVEVMDKWLKCPPSATVSGSTTNADLTKLTLTVQTTVQLYSEIL